MQFLLFVVEKSGVITVDEWEKNRRMGSFKSTKKRTWKSKAKLAWQKFAYLLSWIDEREKQRLGLERWNANLPVKWAATNFTRDNSVLFTFFFHVWVFLRVRRTSPVGFRPPISAPWIVRIPFPKDGFVFRKFVCFRQIIRSAKRFWAKWFAAIYPEFPEWSQKTRDGPRHRLPSLKGVAFAWMYSQFFSTCRHALKLRLHQITHTLFKVSDPGVAMQETSLFKDFIKRWPRRRE